jgi:hypothetical protein
MSQAGCRGFGRKARGPRKNQRHDPSEVQDFIDLGGMRQVEYLAAADAADQAKRFEPRMLYSRVREPETSKLLFPSLRFCIL